MLLTITPPSRPPPTSATCCTSTRTGCSRASSRSGRRTSSTPRRPTSGARRRCCSRSTRSGLVRGRRPGPSPGAVRQRPAVRRLVVPQRSRSREVFGTALTGRCKRAPGAGRAAAPARGHAAGAALPRRRRTSSGGCSSRWATTVDGRAPSRSTSASRSGATRRYFARDADGRRAALADLLDHLYVLLPVLDDAKHYWVGDDEVDKLLRRGEGWLADAPGAGADRPPLPEAPAAA